MADQAFGDVTLDQLLLDGKDLDAQLAEVITDAVLSRTIDGAPTLSIGVVDGTRRVLKSGILDQLATCQIDGRSFELTQISKSGDRHRLTFEDLAVAELRRHDTPRKFAAGTVTRVQAARAILQAETPWIGFAVSAAAKQNVAKVELSRGQVAVAATASGASGSTSSNYFDGGGGSSGGQEVVLKAQKEVREDSWTCFKRWFAEINWRCYVDNGVVNVGPDSAYNFEGGGYYKLREFTDAVDTIDFDYDTGKATATATVMCRAGRWQSPPGTPVELFDMGPANGLWIVGEISRSLFSTSATIKLFRPEPELPEPDPPPEPSESVDGAGGGSYFPFSGADLGSSGGGGGGTGNSGFFWPVSGKYPITSPFGPRARNNHQGVDIGAPTGTPIYAARSGTVTFAGSQSGYGNVVYMQHGGKGEGASGGSIVDRGNIETRYGHMSRITTRRGLFVTAGSKVGEVGQTGDASGPHLHFEIRFDGTAVDPVPLLGDNDSVSTDSLRPDG